MKNWKFYLETYGCKVNQHESQLIRESWQKLGGVECARPEEANFVCINSCAITGKAERDARNAVFRMKRVAPDAHVILTGCAAQFFADFVPRKKANYARPDLCVAQKNKKALLAGPWLDGKDVLLPASVPARSVRARPVVKIQDGCRQNCAYCIVPSTRPVLESASPAKILAECRGLLAAGHSELMLSGINLRMYGKDKPEYGDFWDVLQYLIKGLEPEFGNSARLRISSLEPAMLTEKGLCALSASRMICPHLHLSLQHASPEVLRRMGRGHYTMDKILLFLEKIKIFWPLAGIGADFIAGFPEETEEDLDMLIEFINMAPLTYAHVFPYSRRQNTPALSYPGQLTMEVKNRRAALVREAVAKKKYFFWRKLLGLEHVLVAPDLEQEKNGGLRRGVNEHYVPCLFADGCSGTGLVRAKPLQVLDNGILVKGV